MNWFQYNKQYIQAVNSCNRDAMFKFFNDIADMPGAYRKKYYIWNWIRGKDFYMNLADHVVRLARVVMYREPDIDCTKEMKQIEYIVKEVIASEKKEQTIKSFVWNITKHAPVLTVDTIKYISEDRLTHILTKNDQILNDETLNPLIKQILILRGRIKDAEEALGINND